MGTSDTIFPYTTLFRSTNFQWRTPLLAAEMIFEGQEVPSEWVLPQDPITADELDEYLDRNEGMPDGHYAKFGGEDLDRKSTRLNSSHVAISYAVFCLKK